MILKIGLCFLVMKLIEISAIELKCVYFDTVDGYNCKADNLAIESPNQKITKVNGEHVKDFSEVEVFNVHRNLKLKYLPIGLNDRFPQLKKLYVQLSSLKYISKNDFYDLNSLEIINFAGNQIETIPIDVFSTLDQLKHLSLSNNKITNIYSSTFGNLPKLQELYLQDNKIEELDENLINNNLELKIVLLSRNRLKIIGPKLVSQLMKLTKIEFSGDDNCVKKNYDLTSNNKSSLLTIEKDLKAFCSETKKNDLNQESKKEKRNIKESDKLELQLDNAKREKMIKLINENLNLAENLLNQNQTFNKEISELKEKHSKDLDEMRKATDALTLELNNLITKLKNDAKVLIQMFEGAKKINQILEVEKNQLKDEKLLLQKKEKDNVNLIKENQDLTSKLQNQNQIFNQENFQLLKKLQENFKVVDGLKKSSEIVKKQFYELQQTHDKLKTDSINLKNKNNNLTQEVSNQKNKIAQLIKEIFEIKFNLTAAEKLNSSWNKTESIILMNDNKILNTTLHNSKSDIASKFNVIFSYVKNHRDETLLLCSGCFNIFLIILLILLMRKKFKIENNIDTTFILAGNRTSTN